MSELYSAKVIIFLEICKNICVNKKFYSLSFSGNYRDICYFNVNSELKNREK